MTSWIFVLSKFTPEALLFEALAIFLLIAGYAAFWILRKRRLGAVGNEIPSSVVKAYLNELIGEASDMRNQLFGLLSGGTIPSSSVRQRTHIPTVSVGHDEGATQALAALESKMAEQAKAMEKIVADKAKLEKELTDAKSKGGGTAAPAEVQKLQDKCQTLEARLAEYSVIEDDLANLKRLQQENAQLKSQLGTGGAAAVAPAAAAPAAAPTAAPVAAPVEVPAPAAAAEPDLGLASEFAAATAEPALAAPAAAPEAASPLAAAEPGFEGLVDQVGKSLQMSADSAPSGATAQPEAVAAAPAAAAASAANTATQAPVEKSDEDLIAEFEKMLNS